MEAARNIAERVKAIPKGATGPAQVPMSGEDAERLLYERAGKEKPALHGKSAEERALDATGFEGDTPEELAVKTAKIAKSGANSSLQMQRAMRDIRDTLDIHSVSLIGMQDTLANLRRAMRVHDVSVKATESAHNPQLNPLLVNYLPFDSQPVVEEFFEVNDRTIALQRYVSKMVPWDPSTFAHNMVALLCTYQYRIDYAFPGERNTIAKLAYIPERLEVFLKSAAEFVARESGKVADMKTVKNQLRRAFQASKVRREREANEERALQPDERIYPYGMPPAEHGKKEDPKKAAGKRKKSSTGGPARKKRASAAAAEKSIRDGADAEASASHDTEEKESSEVINLSSDEEDNE